MTKLTISIRPCQADVGTKSDLLFQLLAHWLGAPGAGSRSLPKRGYRYCFKSSD